MPKSSRLQMDQAMSLSLELGRLTQVYNNRLAQLLSDLDVTFPQFTILDYILQMGPEGTSVGQISKAVEVLQPAVTKTVKKFAARGILTVTTVENDKRQKTIVITPDGAAFIGRLRAALLPDVLNCFENWPADKIERFSSDLVAFRTWLQDNRV